VANDKVFCNLPWFEININHDGSYDICGCQVNKLVYTPLGKVHNIKKVPINEYWNGDRMKEARLRKLGDEPDPMCAMCQVKDEVGYASTRVKENYKSVIFPVAFHRSFQQSPNFPLFDFSAKNFGLTTSVPKSLHLNIGHTCNFACRMCGPAASSRLQQEYKELKWADKDQLYDHWTDDPRGWQNFLDFLDQSGDQISVIHVIGGEVGFIPKFFELIDLYINRGWAKNLNLSFTSNGSIDYTIHNDKLSQFKRCEIGFSIESVNHLGDYIRRGGDILSILKNIQKAIAHQTTNQQFVIRTVPSVMSLLDYDDLIIWSLSNNIPVDNSILVNLPWLRADILPYETKLEIRNRVQKLKDSITVPVTNQAPVQKDPTRIALSIINECDAIIGLTSRERPANADQLLKECASKLSQWDQMKGINLKDFSFPLYTLLSKYGYQA
jgi:MoaA/NifB/PqqE/SkfB family radical SAM enzyme